MPREVKITTTCDLCDEKAEMYPSFFDLLDDTTYGPWVSVMPGSNLCRKVKPLPRISTKGCLRPGLSVCLCKEHMASVVAALEAWLLTVAVEEGTPKA